MSHDIKVVIPFADEKRNYIYKVDNEIMSHEGWTLVLDHDVFICHPFWYKICQKLIDKHPDAGVILCRSSRSPIKDYVPPGAPEGDDLSKHIAFAARLWQQNGLSTREVKHRKIPGPFLLINKEIWKDIRDLSKVGNVLEYFDAHLALRLLKHGLKKYVATGLYVYHLYDYESNLWKGSKWVVN